MKVSTCTAVVVVLFLIPYVCAAESPAGYVKTVKGAACVIRQEEFIPAAAGGMIFKNDVLRTGPDGSLGVTFLDDTVMSLGPDSEVALKDFAFSPAEGRMTIFTHMLQGTVVYLSGIISRLSPDAVRFETPSVTISISGTRFAVKVEGSTKEICR